MKSGGAARTRGAYWTDALNEKSLDRTPPRYYFLTFAMFRRF